MKETAAHLPIRAAVIQNTMLILRRASGNRKVTIASTGEDLSFATPLMPVSPCIVVGWSGI